MAVKVTPLLDIKDCKDSVALVEKVIVGGHSSEIVSLYR